MKKFALENDFVKLVYIKNEDGEIILNDKNRIWDEAYKQCQDEDCVYLKFDDDIVYFDETLFTDFIKYRIENEEAPLLFPTIINNSYFSWLFEKKQIYTPVNNNSNFVNANYDTNGYLFFSKRQNVGDGAFIDLNLKYNKAKQFLIGSAKTQTYDFWFKQTGISNTRAFLFSRASSLSNDGLCCIIFAEILYHFIISSID